MLRRALPFVLAAAVIAPLLAQTKTIPPTYPQCGVITPDKEKPAYFPERFDWEHRTAEDVGMNGARVTEAVQLALAADTPGTHDMALFLHSSFGKELFSTIVGPIKDR